MSRIPDGLIDDAAREGALRERRRLRAIVRAMRDRQVAVHGGSRIGAAGYAADRLDDVLAAMRAPRRGR